MEVTSDRSGIMSPAGNCRNLAVGSLAPGFEAVRDVFVSNFDRSDDFRETGAAVAVFHRGRRVVDLCGGVDGDKPWTSDKLLNVWSTTKGIVAIAVARLVDQGRLRYEDTVASVWPEFAAAGKDRITIAQVLSHQAGLNGFIAPLAVKDLFDWNGCCARLAAQPPAWEPGTAASYHALTFGWLAGEVVRRTTGLSLGEYLQAEIAGPLNADIYVGLPAAIDARVAATIAARGDAPPLDVASVALQALINPIVDASLPNRRDWRAAEIPAANGHASALGLARRYGALAAGGILDEVRILSPRAIDAMRTRAPGRHRDMLMGITDGWGMGVLCNLDGIYGPGAGAFGHSGWGGSFGCADPELGLGIGYVCAQMGTELTIDPRSVALAAAAGRCAQALA